VVSISRWFIYY